MPHIILLTEETPPYDFVFYFLVSGPPNLTLFYREHDSNVNKLDTHL